MKIKLQCSQIGKDAYFMRFDVGERAKHIGWQGKFTPEKVGGVLKLLEEWAGTI